MLQLKNMQIKMARSVTAPAVSEAVILGQGGGDLFWATP